MQPAKGRHFLDQDQCVEIGAKFSAGDQVRLEAQGYRVMRFFGNEGC
jgi:hypothetical protein